MYSGNQIGRYHRRLPLTPPSNRPRVLIVTRYAEVYGAAKLPKNLVQAGFEVAALRPEDSFIARTRYVSRHYSFPLRPKEMYRRLLQVMSSWKPDFVVPGDSLSLQFLQRATRLPSMRQRSISAVEIIERSLGDPAHYGVLDSKQKVQEVARRLNLRTPDDVPIDNPEQAGDVADEYGYPVVLKQDAWSGGRGVAICRTRASVASTAREYLKPEPEPDPAPIGLRSIVRRLLGRETVHVKRTVNVSIQRHIAGEPTAYNFIAINGDVLAGNLVYKKLPFPPPTGPCCVLERTENAEADEAARALIEYVGFTGFGAIDFMIEHESNAAYVLESNPVPTSVTPLGAVLGQDLCAALYRAITGDDSVQINNPAPEAVVALFPHELLRDPSSPIIRMSPHDVPFDDPDLLEAFNRHADIPAIELPERHPEGV